MTISREQYDQAFQAVLAAAEDATLSPVEVSGTATFEVSVSLTLRVERDFDDLRLVDGSDYPAYAPHSRFIDGGASQSIILVPSDEEREEIDVERHVQEALQYEVERDGENAIQDAVDNYTDLEVIHVSVDHVEFDEVNLTPESEQEVTEWNENV